MTTSVLTVITPNPDNPAYGTTKGSPLTVSETDKNLNDLSTGVNVAQQTADAALPKAGGTITGSLVISSTAAYPLSVQTSYGGTSAVDFKNTNGNNWMACNVSAAGTGSSFVQAYNASGSNFLGSIRWDNNKAFTLNGANQDRYGIDSAGNHYFRANSTTGNYNFANSDNSFGTLLQFDSTNSYIYTNNITNLHLSGKDATFLRTEGGTPRNHYLADKYGGHYSDTPETPGGLDQHFFPRSVFYCDGGTTIYYGNISSYRVSVSSGGTGIYNFTITSPTKNSYAYPYGMATSGDYGVSRVVAFRATSATTFTVYVRNSVTGNLESGEFGCTLFW
jgi:hypothetical protein